MNKILLIAVLAVGIVPMLPAQTCSSCGGTSAASSLGDDTSPSLNISLGALQYGQSAGELSFSGSLSIAQLSTPASLQFNSPSSDLVSVFTNTDGSLRQINAPQASADIPPPPTSNGYLINFYYPSQISGQAGGTNLFTGNPFATWMITNSNPSGIAQLQITESLSNNVIKQWTYTYSTNTGAWTVTDLAGVAETMIQTNLGGGHFQIINSIQYGSGTPAQVVAKTYKDFSWGSAPIQIAVGPTNAPQITTYTYYDPAPTANAYVQPVCTVVNPDGSWMWYAAYDTNGMATNVYSSFGNVATNNASNARRTLYTYNPVAAVVSSSGDTGIYNALTPRRTITYIQEHEISRSYSVFPSVNARLDIQCTTPGAAWNASGNLVTTNYFFTSGPNQFALQYVIQPDGTMTTYNYITNGLYRTNITVTGQANTSYTGVVDGVSNVVVLNYAGYTVSSTSYDVLSGLLLSQNIYGTYDSYGRPQQVTHLDGTSEYTYYDCCGLDYTVDKDGVSTDYLYDPAKRQVGYEKFYGSSGIAYTNLLDAAGRTLQSVRVGTDNSPIVMSQAAYDQAGELIAQTNALGGGTHYIRTNDSTTGGLIRITANPDGGIITNFYFLDGSLKKTAGTAVHGARYVYGYGTDASGNTSTYTEEIKLKADGTDSSETTTTYTDIAGRTTEILYADGSKSLSYYNALGQLWKQVDPDGVTTLYQYNGKGEQSISAIAMAGSGATSPNFSGMDHITATTNDVITDHGTTVRRNRTFVWDVNNSGSSDLVSMTEVAASGLNVWQTQYRDIGTPVTSTNTTGYGSNSRAVTNSAPNGSYTVSIYSYGRLSGTTNYDSTRTRIGSTTCAYDAHGRQYQTADTRNGTTTYGFNNADQVTTVTTPNPGNGGSAETTTTYYDTMQRAYEVIQPDGNAVNSVLSVDGRTGPAIRLAHLSGGLQL